MAGSLGVVASVLDRCGILVIGIDSSELTTIYSSYTLDIDVAFALLGAITTGAVQLTIVVYVEVQKDMLVRHYLKELGK